MTRYLAGLCVCSLGACGGGWLVAGAAWSASGHWDRSAACGLATGAWLLAVAVTGIACWAVSWRRRLRSDGVLPVRAGRQLRREARLAARAAARQAKAARNDVPERVAAVQRPGDDLPAADTGQLLAELRTLLGPLLVAADAADAMPCGHDSPDQCGLGGHRGDASATLAAAGPVASAATAAGAAMPAAPAAASVATAGASAAGAGPGTARAPAMTMPAPKARAPAEPGKPVPRQQADGGVALLSDAEEAW